MTALDSNELIAITHETLYRDDGSVDAYRIGVLGVELAVRSDRVVTTFPHPAGLYLLTTTDALYAVPDSNPWQGFITYLSESVTLEDQFEVNHD